jgi:hypothetical protein
MTVWWRCVCITAIIIEMSARQSIHIATCCFALLLGTFTTSVGQEKHKFTLHMKFKELGIWSGFGYGIDYENLPEGNYSPVNFSAQFAYKSLFLADDTTAGRENFLLFLEPMYNYVTLISDKGNKQEWDAGLSTGVRYDFSLLPSLRLSFQVASGPHWHSTTTSRQAPGFVFSNHVGLALYQNIGKRLSVNFMFRIRHMSNADTRQPNNGINTNNYIWGISYKL